MKTALFLIFILLGAGAAWGTWNLGATAVVFENQRSQRLTKVRVEVGKQEFLVGTVEANSREVVRLTHSSRFGESDIKLSFTSGEKEQEWKGGYIEPGYKVKLVVSDAGIQDRYLSIQSFLFGL